MSEPLLYVRPSLIRKIIVLHPVVIISSSLCVKRDWSPGLQVQSRRNALCIVPRAARPLKASCIAHAKSVSFVPVISSRHYTLLS